MCKDEMYSLNSDLYLYRNPLEYTLLRKRPHSPTSVQAHLNLTAGKIIETFNHGKKIDRVLTELKSIYGTEHGDEILNFINVLISKEILVSDKRERVAVVGTDKMFLPITLQIEVTRRCPLNCKHCYIKNRDLEERITPEALLEILDLFEPYNLPLNVQITGGDPLLRKDIFDILDILEKRKKDFLSIPLVYL